MDAIAFIGLGHMGAGMAANQAKAGREVRAFDIVPSALERAEKDGCRRAPNIGEAVRGAGAVITMLPAAAHVRAVWEGEVIPNASRGTLLIDCSTVDVETARDLGKKAGAAGLRAADAPVSGGVAAAEAGTLAFMVGCDESVYDDVAEALAPMSKAVIRAGAPGAGQAAKICNNMVLGVTMLGLCEALALAEKLELAPERFFEIASQSSGQCWSLTSYCPWPGPVPAAPSNRNYEGGFLSSLMLKDLKLAQDAAAKAGAAAPLGAQAEALYALFDRLGFGGKDFSAVLQLFRGRLGEL
ncbi:MAG TPA: 3-hydroxyisobutyrate dehydrogenase [Caulobacteraceae bacterium]|nr:3-hydroxyisobutyrate dehydrogenase [Caulobacteraceae bacterium]